MRYAKSSADKVWIVGSKKKDLEDAGMEVYACEMVHMGLWAYSVDERQFRDYLVKHNLPELSYTLSGA